MDNSNTVFYLGTNTAEGYAPIFDRAYSPFSESRTYIIKGASSSARSALISEAAQELEKEGFFCEKIISPIDSAVEGAIFKELNVCIFDGSRANLLDPVMCDCTEYIVNIGNLCDRKKLFSMRNDIIPLYFQSKEHSRKCSKFMNAASAMREDTVRVIGDCLSAEKLERYVTRFTAKEFGTASEIPGKETLRYLSAVTPSGITTQYETMQMLCARIFVLDDKTGCVSDPFICQLKDAALLCGYDVITCIDPISGSKHEHIIIPELSIGIFTSDETHKWKSECARKISSSRFTDREIIRNHKGRVKFNLDAVHDLTEQAALHMAKLSACRSALNEIYDGATDMSGIKDAAMSVKKDILALVEAE